MRLFRRLAILAVVVAIAYPLWIAFQIWQQSRDDETHAADVIIVLGAAQYDGEPSPVFKARLDQATYLYDEDLADVLIVTGGRLEGDRFSEAEVAHAYLEGQGIPAESILEETRGRTTFESMREVGKIARERELDSALLVSDPLHSERVKRIASDMGFEDSYASWASYERLNRSRETKLRELAHEVGAILVYEFFGR